MLHWRNSNFTEHAPDSPNERWGLGGSSFTRQFDLTDGLFLTRLQAAYDLYGYAVVVPNPSPPSGTNGVGLNYISRVTPMPYPSRTPQNIIPAPDVPLPAGVLPPDMTNRFFAVAGPRTEPLGKPLGTDLLGNTGTAANYVRARLTVEFSTLPYQIKNDQQIGVSQYGVADEGAALARGWQNTRYIIRHLEPFSRLIKIPYGMTYSIAYTVPTGGSKLKPLKVGLPIREGGCVAQYTWMRIPLGVGGSVSGINFGRISSALGTINQFPFDFAAAQTLYFDNFATREYQGYFGEPLVDASFKFVHLPHPSTGNNWGGGTGGGPKAGTLTGWNTVFDIVQDSTGTYQKDYYPVTMSLNATVGQPPFEQSDFSTFFSP